jgi:hypothetical protein
MSSTMKLFRDLQRDICISYTYQLAEDRLLRKDGWRLCGTLLVRLSRSLSEDFLYPGGGEMLHLKTGRLFEWTC